MAGVNFRVPLICLFIGLFLRLYSLHCPKSNAFNSMDPLEGSSVPVILNGSLSLYLHRQQLVVWRRLAIAGIRRAQFTWAKHGYIFLAAPDRDPSIDITICMDIFANPGPSTSASSDERPNRMCLGTNTAGSTPSCLADLPSKGLVFSQYNVCHIINKLDEIKLILSSVSNWRHGRPNLVLGISETFLAESWSNAALSVDHYSLLRADRPVGSGEGLLVYIPSHLPVKRRTDLEREGVECFWLELHFPHSSPCLGKSTKNPIQSLFMQSLFI